MSATITDSAEEMLGMATNRRELQSSHTLKAENSRWEVMTCCTQPRFPYCILTVPIVQVFPAQP